MPSERKVRERLQIKRFEIVAEPFSVEGGELTPTMKLKRRVIHEKYADQIAALYA